jgi:2-oxo-hept-3-ene-1,7-dioate hydratase
MNQDAINTIATTLQEAKVGRSRLDGASLGLAANDIELAYRVQARLAEPSHRVGGWKIGAANIVQQEMLAISEPFFGAIFTDDIFPVGAQIAAARFQPAIIEPEIGFELSDAVSDLAVPVTLANVGDFIAALRPVFEIFNPRLDPPFAAGAAPLIADRGGNGGLVIGAACPACDWSLLADITATLVVNGELIETGSAKIVLDNPINSLMWFLNAAQKQNLKLAAGQVIASGSLTKPYPASKGETIEAVFDQLGQVSVSLTP